MIDGDLVLQTVRKLIQTDTKLSNDICTLKVIRDAGHILQQHSAKTTSSFDSSSCFTSAGEQSEGWTNIDEGVSEPTLKEKTALLSLLHELVKNGNTLDNIEEIIAGAEAVEEEGTKIDTQDGENAAEEAARLLWLIGRKRKRKEMKTRKEMDESNEMVTHAQRQKSEAERRARELPVSRSELTGEETKMIARTPPESSFIPGLPPLSLAAYKGYEVMMSTIYSSEYTAINAFDNNPGTICHTQNFTPHQKPYQWLSINLPEPREFTAAEITARASECYFQTPTEFDICGRVSPDDDWTVLCSRSGVYWAKAGQTQCFTFDSTLNCRYYRLVMKNNQSGQGGMYYLSLARFMLGFKYPA